MFYSQFILAKKGPLGTIWIAAHLERKLRKNQVTETNISVSVDSILFPEVPIALRLSGHLLLGVVRIYSRKVNYLFHDCSEALVKIKQAFHAGAVDLPPEAATAPFHSITLPETFDLDEFEPLPDREMNLLHSSGAADHHVTTREQITLQDPLEDSSYLESQFGLDERFPEGEVSRMGMDFDEDLLDKPSREATPDAVSLQEDEVPTAHMDDGIDYDQMDRMEAMDMDDHHEPGTPALGMDDMDLDYQPGVEGIEDGDVHRDLGVTEDFEPDHHAEQIELDNFEPDLNKPEQLEPATPGTLETGQEEGKGDLVEETEKEVLEGGEHAQKEGLEENGETLNDEDVAVEKEEAERRVEEEEKTGGEHEAATIEEREDEDNREMENMPEEPPIEDSKRDDENKQDVPEYETVMSAVEVPNQEPDVFDLDQDMEKDVPEVMFKDQDEYMEDREVLLVEDREVGVDLEDQLLPAQGPASPGTSPPMPAFDPDVLPEDGDVLASLLGRGTPALKLIPTPNEAVVVAKPRRKQGPRKRKIVMDMNTILPADVMREQLMVTDDIRRVRRKAPCTRQELWSVQKDALGQQIFCEHSVPGLCSDLRVLFQRVYVAGAANLPLADDVQAEAEPEPEPEPVASEPIPEQQEVSLVDDVTGKVRENSPSAEPHIELQTEDENVQGPPDEVLRSEPDVEREPVGVAVDEFPREHNEAAIVDDGQEARVESWSTEQDKAPHGQALQTVEIEGNETSNADHAPAEMVKEDEIHETNLFPSRTEAAEKAEGLLMEGTPLAEGQEHVEEQQEVAPPAAEEVDANVTRSPAPEVAVPEPGPQPEVEVEALHVAENATEEDLTDARADLMPEAVPEMVPSVVPEYDSAEEQKEPQESAAHEADETQVSSPPVQFEQAHLNEEQLAVEELGFLGDAGDTVFLAADDDELCEEAEDFQDGNEYGQNEKSVQDNSGWSARTRAVGHYLRSSLESKYAHMRKREEEGIPKLGLDQILIGKSRKEAARMFFETLVLKTKDYIHVEQESPYGDVHISARPKLLKANF